MTVLGPGDPRAITNLPKRKLTRRERDLFRFMRDADLFDLDPRIDKDAFFASLDDPADLCTDHGLKFGGE